MYRLIAALLMGAGSVIGSFFYGMHIERTKAKVAGLEAFAGRVDRALDIADEFIKIGTEFANKKAEVQIVTKEVVRKQVEYVKANNVPDVTVPAFILGLRTCQINRIRQAAGYPVLSGSDAALCSPGGPVDRPSPTPDIQR